MGTPIPPIVLKRGCFVIARGVNPSVNLARFSALAEVLWSSAPTWTNNLKLKGQSVGSVAVQTRWVWNRHRLPPRKSVMQHTIPGPNQSGAESHPRVDHPRGTWVVDLPAHIGANDGQLHAAAARLLELAHVRSVIVDRSRTQAQVRLRHLNHAPAEVAHWPTHMLAEESEDATPLPIVHWTDPRDESLCFIKLPARAEGWRRALLLVAAVMTLILGLLGIVLPGLPTTPFVLLASYCLLRSSPALHERLIHGRLFGGVLRDWHLHRGIRPHIRYKASVVVLLVVGASLAFTNLPLGAKLAIAAVAACGIAYIWRLPEVAETPLEAHA